MISTALRELMGPRLAGAFDEKGYEALTAVQEAVLDPTLAGQDLRISSQTGSGKTLAIGLILREVAALPVEAPDGKAQPTALVIVPTRELAKQVEEELRWFYAPLEAQVACVTGGMSYRDERRALGRGPAVVVGTPGRLLDYLERGGIDPSAIQAVVLDEADRMLDLGFREALEAILGFAPEGHRTHLVSATFPPDVRRLADRVQQDPAHVQGTPLGSANADIDHVVHLVAPTERLAAMINLLLANPDGQTLVFARTRADVAEIAAHLDEAGFRVTSLSGEMEQRERMRALSAFKRGDLHALVATDVAARGIDVQDIARVIHAEPPTDADTYTHRSGRTGRAGRKGTSSVLAMPNQVAWTKTLLKRARVAFRFEPIPTAEAIRAASDERLFDGLAKDEGEPDVAALSLAERLITEADATRVVAKLLTRLRSGATIEPREVQVLVPAERPSRTRDARAGEDRRGRDREPTRQERGPRRERADAGEGFADQRANSARETPRSRPGPGGDWVPFRVTWGGLHGADPRRLLAIVCRRGGIRGSDVGSIDVQRNYSVVDVAGSVASSFAEEASRPDPRDPRVRISPLGDDGPRARAQDFAERRPRDFGQDRPKEPAIKRPRDFGEDRPKEPAIKRPAKPASKDKPNALGDMKIVRRSATEGKRQGPAERHAAKHDPRKGRPKPAAAAGKRPLKKRPKR